MLVAYIDETYSKNIEHTLVALVLPADQIKNLEDLLDGVVEKARKQHSQLSESIELHAYELSSGDNGWEGIAPRARVRIFKNAIRAICSIEGAMYCSGTVDLSLRNPADAHEWALKFVLECSDSVACREKQNILAICDDVDQKQKYQHMFAKVRQHGTGGMFPSYLRHFTDGLHFTPSHFSRPIQAVDMLSYVYRRHHITPYDDDRAAKVIHDCWEMMKPLREKGNQRSW